MLCPARTCSEVTDMACSAVEALSRRSHPSTPAMPESSPAATATPRCAAAQKHRSRINIGGSQQQACTSTADDSLMDQGLRKHYCVKVWSQAKPAESPCDDGRSLTGSSAGSASRHGSDLIQDYGGRTA